MGERSIEWWMAYMDCWCWQLSSMPIDERVMRSRVYATKHQGDDTYRKLRELVENSKPYGLLEQ